MRVRVCVCARAHARGCMRVLNINHVFAGIMSVEEVGGRRVGRECESEIFTYYFIFIVILNVPS